VSFGGPSGRLQLEKIKCPFAVCDIVVKVQRRYAKLNGSVEEMLILTYINLLLHVILDTSVSVTTDTLPSRG
jgi:hypothetical protein